MEANSAEEDVASGQMYLTSSDLEICRDGSSMQLVGIVLPSVALTSASTVSNSHLVFDIDEVRPESVAPLTVRIFGEASISPAQPSSSAPFSTRTRTTARLRGSSWMVRSAAERATLAAC